MNRVVSKLIKSYIFFLFQYANKSTQTYFPAGLGPLTDETVTIRELKRKWQSRLGDYHEDVGRLVRKFSSWEEGQIKFAETQLTDLRETRVLMQRLLLKCLAETHIKGVIPEENSPKRRRRMSQ